ncbi:MAG TPA: prephenate dehydratase domain-containing protein [Stellaceae bacterium]|jgi:prephenate dehydratase|nr:prephenate dehydratase domain-containing protein [Stellaceae bacterium]
MRIGTLGSSATFAGEATEAIRAQHPEFSASQYFKSMDDCWDELANGTVDAVVLGVERTGQAHHGAAVATRGFYVTDMIALPLLCNLYVKPGTRHQSVRQITGHGSIMQCIPWLDQHFPGIPREKHRLNSVEAAKDVLAGDGTSAVVGSRSLTEAVPGLEILAERIDDGSLANWWLVSAQPHFSDRPATIVVGGIFGPDGRLGDMIASVQHAGYNLATIAGFPVSHGLSTYHYLGRFHGQGERRMVESKIAPFSARLVGAF